MSFKTLRGDKYRGAFSETAETRIMRNLRRDWDRQPGLRSEYGGNFQRYLVSVKHNVTFV